MINNPIIEVNGVSLEFPSTKNRLLKEIFSDFFKEKHLAETETVTAVNNITFDAFEGEKIGIIGGNGSGKSTILRLISKVYEPTSGSVIVNGNIAPLLELGGGFQPEFTGRENIFLNCSILGMKPEEIRSTEAEIINFSGIGDAIDRPVKTYSSGMYVRLAFSIATTKKPEILIIDEVLGAGDLDFAEKARRRIMNLIDYSKVLVIVSHDLNQIENLTNRVIWVNNGEIASDGLPKDVIGFYKSSNR